MPRPATLAGGVAEYRSSEGKTVKDRPDVAAVAAAITMTLILAAGMGDSRDGSGDSSSDGSSGHSCCRPQVPYRGPIDETVRDILGGMRSACTYVGAAHLKAPPSAAPWLLAAASLCKHRIKPDPGSLLKPAPGNGCLSNFAFQESAPQPRASRCLGACSVPSWAAPSMRRTRLAAPPRPLATRPHRLVRPTGISGFRGASWVAHLARMIYRGKGQPKRLKPHDQIPMSAGAHVRSM